MALSLKSSPWRAIFSLNRLSYSAPLINASYKFSVKNQINCWEVAYRGSLILNQDAFLEDLVLEFELGYLHYHLVSLLLECIIYTLCYLFIFLLL